VSTETHIATMSWPEPRHFVPYWDLPMIWMAHHLACPGEGEDFSVSDSMRSPTQFWSHCPRSSTLDLC
jgi:hypothetical protein